MKTDYPTAVGTSESIKSDEPETRVSPGLETAQPFHRIQLMQSNDESESEGKARP